MLKDLSRLIPTRSLTAAEITSAVANLTREDVAVDTKADFLIALTQRGEAVEEIAGFAREMRARSVKPPIPERLRTFEILDIVGTGGDRLSTFNISTCASLVCAAAGVLVAKHGNRASTSPVGSADVAEALGLPFDVTPEQSVALLDREQFCYFFAPGYHPSFKHIIPARRLCAQRGYSTIFNFLGPLLNPGNPSAMLLGAPRPELCEPLARVLQSLGVRRAMVVSGAVTDTCGTVKYLDEISPLGPTTVVEFYQEHGINKSTISPLDFPLQPATLADLRGGDKAVNCRIIRDILGGKETGPRKDAVCLNAAAALFIAGRTPTMSDGWDLARQTIESGRAGAKLEALDRIARGLKANGA